jgi:hypothetical protein
MTDFKFTDDQRAALGLIGGWSGICSCPGARARAGRLFCCSRAESTGRATDSSVIQAMKTPKLI